MKNDASSAMMKAKQKKPWLIISMVVLYCLYASNANFVYATSDTLNLGVTAHITAKCAFMTGGPSGSTVSFGQYNAILENATSPARSSGGFDAKCTKSTTTQIAMDPGLYAGHATVASHAMSDGQGNYLSYEIYSDAAMSTVWDSSNTVSYTDQGNAFASLPIYASIPAGQDVPAGEYSDTVTMTLSY